eukprot:NODE_457_length_8231_cov_0.314068.p5 type:complete len:195 gc:universal NODE_457_length_8231_cov_0.314068:8025-7441(-)
MRKQLIKCVVLGDASVGKTSLIHQFVYSKFEDNYKATIGADFMTKEIFITDTLCTLQLWDTAGMEKFASLGVAFYRGADVCVLCFDLTSAATLDHVLKWKDEFNVHANPSQDFTFICVGNKCDAKERVITHEQATLFCKQHRMQYMESSAKENINVKEIFELVAEKGILNVKKDQDQPQHVDFTEITNQNKGCC